MRTFQNLMNFRLWVLLIGMLMFFPGNAAGEKGNVDGVDGVDLKDAVLSLKILANTITDGIAIKSDADVDGDGKIGLAEAIYVLQKVASSIWYKDADGDGYSDGMTLIAKTQPAGYYPASELTAVSGDLDDEDSSVNPGAGGSGVTLQMTYTVPPIQVKPAALGDDDVQKINFGSAPLAGEPGEPVLPVIPARIMLPDGFDMDGLEVTHGTTVDLSGSYEIEYGQQPYPLLEDVTPTLTAKNPVTYGSDAPYPGKLYDVVGIQKLRGISILLVNLHPVEYKPLSGKVTYYKDMSVKVFSSQNRKRSTANKNIRYRTLAGRNPKYLVDNPGVLGTYKEADTTRAKRDGNGLCNSADSFQYVLITSQVIKNATTSPNVNDLIAHRKAQGISATIVTIEDIYANYSGVDQAEQLRNFIRDAYNNWETDFVLLGGDTNIIPMRKLWCRSWEGSGAEVDYIPSDLYYQCLDGTFNSDGDDKWGEPNDGENGGDVDLYAELYVGRASAENAQEMANFIYKTLTYENDNSKYKKRVLMCGEQLGFGGVSEYAKNLMEEIRTGTSTHGYNTSGFASDASFSVDTLYEKDRSWGTNDIIDTINSNNFSVINHLGHADYNYVKHMFNPHTDMLNNSFPVFAYSQGCIPGNFEEDCIAERLTTSSRYGMFAVVYNSRYGWGSRDSTDGPSQRYNREFWDAYFSEGYFYLGAMNADSHEDNAWRIDQGCMRWCYYESNLLGDPATAFAISNSQETPPVANAGNDQNVTIDTIVTLNGSGSSDADGNVVSYFWEQTEGPAVTINNADLIQTIFTAPDMGTSGGYLTFRLTVTDNDSLKDTDECRVYVEGQEDGIVSFPDANLEAAIRDAIEKPSGDILKSDLQNLFSLDWANKPDDQKIKNIEGIQYCKNLTTLSLNFNQISDISALAGMNNLIQLDLNSNQINDISILAGMNNLTNIALGFNQIIDISALTGMNNLTQLDLNSNQINNISMLAGMNNLTLLGLGDNHISDITALAGMNNLTQLGLSANQISDITALTGMNKMIYLFIGGNQISDISALAGMTNLSMLDVNSNQISDISALAGMNDLYYLYLANNQISDISALAGMNNLTELYLYSNQISNISALTGMDKLKGLYLGDNQISDISALAGMNNLTELYLYSNQISNISALTGMDKLTGIGLSNNQITSINALSGINTLSEIFLDSNQISDITPLINNSGIGNGDTVQLSSNPLSTLSCSTYIPQLQSRGGDVRHDCP